MWTKVKKLRIFCRFSAHGLGDNIIYKIPHCKFHGYKSNLPLIFWIGKSSFRIGGFK